MIVATAPNNFANSVAPFSGIGQKPVGQESSDNRNTVFQAVEESAKSSGTANRRSPDEQGNNEIDERERLREASQDKEASKQEQIEARQDESDLQEVRQLSARDQEVRNHERAHASVGGDLAGAPSFTFVRGPDGVSYAVAGEVQIRTGTAGGDPQATLERAERVRRAALAPADPSGQDRQVAAQAVQVAVEARSDLVSQAAQESERKQEELKADRTREAEDRERAQAERDSREKDDQLLDSQESRERSAETAQDRLNEVSGQTFDIAQRLIEIGVAQPEHAASNIIDQAV